MKTNISISPKGLLCVVQVNNRLLFFYDRRTITVELETEEVAKKYWIDAGYFDMRVISVNFQNCVDFSVRTERAEE